MCCLIVCDGLLVGWFLLDHYWRRARRASGFIDGVAVGCPSISCFWHGYIWAMTALPCCLLLGGILLDASMVVRVGTPVPKPGWKTFPPLWTRVLWHWWSFSQRCNPISVFCFDNRLETKWFVFFFQLQYRDNAWIDKIFFFALGTHLLDVTPRGLSFNLRHASLFPQRL
jgi:hypothetical protein